MPLRQQAELVGRLAETWFRRPATPTRVVMSLTRRCNLRCDMCRVWEMTPRIDSLTPDEVGDIMRQLDRLTWLDLTGGEIFTRKDAEAVVWQVIDNAAALRLLHFPTNGWFSDRVLGLARDIVAQRPDLGLIITVSIDGPRLVHDSIRGRTGSFERALETWLGLREIEGVDVFVGTTLTSSNADQLDALESELRSAAPDFRPDEWHWNWMQVSEHFFGNADGSGPRPVAPEGLVREHIARRGLPRNPTALMELGFLANLEHYLKGEPVGVGCQSLRSTCFISPEGDLYPCHVWDRPLGNLREHSSAELWRSRELLAARDEVKRLDCGGCFTPCEAYPALAGAPVTASVNTAWRLLKIATERA